MEFLKIVLISVAAAMLYGILHDQVTARLCVEYFTIGHPPIFGTDDPTLLGLGWGVLATWWVGLSLGVLLAIVARAGKLPRRTAASLIRPIAVLMAISAGGALLAGIVGWLLASRGMVTLADPLAMEVPTARHVPFLAAGFAHTASYAFGFLGGLVILALVWHGRLSARLPSLGVRS